MERALGNSLHVTMKRSALEEAMDELNEEPSAKRQAVEDPAKENELLLGLELPDMHKHALRPLFRECIYQDVIVLIARPSWKTFTVKA